VQLMDLHLFNGLGLSFGPTLVWGLSLSGMVLTRKSFRFLFVLVSKIVP